MIVEMRRLCIEDQSLRRGDSEPLALPSPEERARRDEENRRRHVENQREGRAAINAWAKRKGFPDVDAYITAKGIHWSAAYVECMRETMAGSPMAGGMNAAISPAAALGVTAREWSPSELAEARKQIGISDGDT